MAHYWRATVQAKWSDIVDGAAQPTWWDAESGGSPQASVPGFFDTVVICATGGNCVGNDSFVGFSQSITVRAGATLDQRGCVTVAFSSPGEPITIEPTGIFKPGVFSVITLAATKTLNLPTFASVPGDGTYGILYLGGYQNVVTMGADIAADTLQGLTAAVPLSLITPTSEAEAAIVDTGTKDIDADLVSVATWGKLRLGSGSHRMNKLAAPDWEGNEPGWVELGSSTITFKTAVFTGAINPEIEVDAPKKLDPGTSTIVVPVGQSLYISGVPRLYDIEVEGTLNLTDQDLIVHDVTGGGLLSWATPRIVWYTGENTFTGSLNNVTIKKVEAAGGATVDSKLRIGVV